MPLKQKKKRSAGWAPPRPHDELTAHPRTPIAGNTYHEIHELCDIVYATSATDRLTDTLQNLREICPISHRSGTYAICRRFRIDNYIVI